MTPIRNSGPPCPWTQRRAHIAGDKLRVLVVDDNPDAAHALALYLSLHDIDCSVAFGGREALSTAAAQDPHIIVMDISMPGCDGYAAGRALRHHADTLNVVIIAHTALQESEVRRHLSDEEFDGYIQKGGEPARLADFLMALVATE